MKITFSGSAEEIAAAIRAVAGVGEVQIRVPDLSWRGMAEAVEQEMKGLVEKIQPGTEATAEPEAKPEPTEQRIKREDVWLEVGDEVKHEIWDCWHKVDSDDNGDDGFPLNARVWMSHQGVTNIPRIVPPVSHFLRNGITYTIED